MSQYRTFSQLHARAISGNGHAAAYTYANSSTTMHDREKATAPLTTSALLQLRTLSAARTLPSLRSREAGVNPALSRNCGSSSIRRGGKPGRRSVVRPACAERVRGESGKITSRITISLPQPPARGFCCIRGRMLLQPGSATCPTLSAHHASFDPRSIPSYTACRAGQDLARAMFARYVSEESKPLRSISISIWGTSGMHTSDDGIVEVLALLSVQPV